MKILTKYLSTTVVYSILLVLLLLMGLELLISFIGQLPAIGQGNYGLWQSFKFVFMDMPYQLYNFFPMAGLLGTLMGLSVLANQNELIAMQAGGLSKAGLMGAVLKAATLVLIFAVLFGEVLAPYAEHQANLFRSLAQHPAGQGKALATQQGVWFRHDEQFIHIGQINHKNLLSDISIFQFNDELRLKQVRFARYAQFENHQWVLKDVAQTHFYGNRTASGKQSSAPWPIQLNPSLLKMAKDEPRNMSLLALRDYIAYLQQNGLHTAIYELTFWKRVLQPFATLLMIFLALPFVFGSIRAVPIGVRLLTGVTLGFTFYILNQFFGPLSLLFHIPPFWGASLPLLLVFSLGGLFFYIKMR